MSGVCNFFAKGRCARGDLCPFRHLRGDRSIVCKHWLRGLCKKGDSCEFLHEYDMTKMPECYFYAKFSEYDVTTCAPGPTSCYIGSKVDLAWAVIIDDKATESLIGPAKSG